MMVRLNKENYGPKLMPTFGVVSPVCKVDMSDRSIFRWLVLSVIQHRGNIRRILRPFLPPVFLLAFCRALNLSLSGGSGLIIHLVTRQLF